MTPPSTATQAEPPAPPPFDRRLELDRLQWIALLVLWLLPIAGLTGVLSPATRSADSTAGPLALQVEYPHRLRHKTALAMRITVKNTGSAELARVTLRVDQSYLREFSAARFEPQAQRIADDRYELELQALRPGETRHWVVEFEGDDWGRYSGHVSAAGPAGEAAEVGVSTLVLP
ncbi:hypothetical protein [Caldimonas brevitalea]|uniref:Uncharacterized protein n=1 Tax=Caldimonas brevitalea TaxID=413882 RepID=A0A0G3BKG3_9BURK|nr:hypothetical protein [Caldimonas brevitalea]AKJ27851.1 hypothetical protein AAW51_1160 [Caldimonas brevitalea]